jgi:hypothetical protein
MIFSNKLGMKYEQLGLSFDLCINDFLVQRVFIVQLLPSHTHLFNLSIQKMIESHDARFSYFESPNKIAILVEAFEKNK